MVRSCALIFVTMLFLHPLMVEAGRPSVSVSQADVQRLGDSVRMRFDAAVPRHTVRSNYKLTLTPLVASGTDTVRFEPVIVRGGTKKRREKQVAILTGIPTAPANEAARGKTFHYTGAVAWHGQGEQWWAGIEQRLEGCCSEKPLPTRTLAQGVFPPPCTVRIPPSEPGSDGTPPHGGSTPLIIPPVGTPPAKTNPVPPVAIPHISVVKSIPGANVTEIPRKWVFAEGELIIDFIVSRTGITPALFENQSTLSEILMAVDSIYRNPCTRLARIEITGYASPEGTIEQNRALGHNRAVALQHFIQQHYTDIPDSAFLLNNGVENWEGLRSLVAASDMKYRDEVLAFIDRTPLLDAQGRSRNTRLKQLHDGEPYRYMLQNFYPRLRNASYIAFYYNELVDPNAEAINRAVALFRTGDYSAAENLLKTVSSDPRSWNAIGACLVMTGRPDEARAWLEKAAAAGDADARANLDR